MLPPSARNAAAFVICAVLAGCTLFDSPPQPPCPRVVTLGEAKKVTLYRSGPGRDLTDVRFQGDIANLVPSCDYDDDGFVDVDVDVEMVFSRGPAAQGDVGSYVYFVAITDPADNIIAKREFPIDVEFPSAALRVGVIEEVTQRIFFAPGSDASGHRIFIGFQLTREQLDDLRSRRN